jgi:hypothetical protein
VPFFPSGCYIKGIFRVDREALSHYFENQLTFDNRLG